MTLIKSISGIRGTIGGIPGEGLTPLDIVKFGSSFGMWVKGRFPGEKIKIIIGRDARLSGEMVSSLLSNTFVGLGIDVIDLGLSTTPTVEMAVTHHKCHAGVILTASHNPGVWNALKLLNEKGEFISGEDGEQVLKLAENEQFEYAALDDLGKVTKIENAHLDEHIDEILKLELVKEDVIKNRHLKIVVDGVCSSGGIAVPKLLKALGVNDIVELYCEPTGIFPHNPEPLAENLTAICDKVKEVGADLGIVVDPDVDRLAFIDENGQMFGEEYTLVAVADYVICHNKGGAVSNLSSTRALKDICDGYNVEYKASAVGEVNVVAKMKEFGAVIGGEGNGGVIYPELHYGRDALVGIALFLTHLCSIEGSTLSSLKKRYPSYSIAKNKIKLENGTNVDAILEQVAEQYKDEKCDFTDGVKIDFPDEWVHLRKSNTEPIIRIYAEATDQPGAEQLAQDILDVINKM